MLANRKYKDTVFRNLFGAEERRHYTLSPYNAPADTDYDDPNLIEMTTLGDVLYMNVKSDVSFIIEDEMSLWEHQPVYNPKPIRELIYFARLYEKHIEQNGLNPYGSHQLSPPTPRCVIFYIGNDRRPGREMLGLIDSFPSGNADVEVTATMGASTKV